MSVAGFGKVACELELAGQARAPISIGMAGAGEHEPTRQIVRKLMHDAQLRRVRARTRRDGVWRRDPWLIIDDESRRRDELLARHLRDMRRCCEEMRRILSQALGEEVGPQFFDEFVDTMERELAARKLVRDFFTARARQPPASDSARD
jgi:hypothetical protein